MKLRGTKPDYERLPHGEKNPLGYQVCIELAREFVREEGETWRSSACIGRHKHPCAMPAECHCKCHGPKEEKPG